MYRALALAVIEANADPSEPSAVTAVAERSDIQLETGRILLNDRDVGSRIREDDVTAAAALVSKHPAAREVLVALQRRAAHSGDVVMEGRDIGTVVLPDAPVKVFLTATLDERAGRRALETGSDSGQTREGIERRDRSDAERVASPLRRAPGAVVIDTTDKTVDQVIEEIVELVLRVQEGKA
jgi:cytidylate kinase